MAIVSVEESTPMSAIPDIGTWCEGNLNTATRCFDVLVSGKCEAGTSKVKLNVRSVDKIPDFFTKNNEGKAVFAEPTAACVIEAAKGYPSWIQIELKNINGNTTSDIAIHACLGIKKQNEDEFFDIIHSGKLTSEYIDVTEDNAVELVPLLSRNSTITNGYTAVTPGKEIQFDDITVPTTGAFNFGSVYRINVNNKGAWLEDQDCDINAVVNKHNGYWWNWGRIGIGTIVDQNGQILKDQLLAVNCFNWLAYSADGDHWTALKSVGINSAGWNTGSAYGNGIWCIVDDPRTGRGIVRSIDGGQNWLYTSSSGSRDINFGNGIFMIVTNAGIVYTSPDAEIWTQVGTINSASTEIFILIHGSDKWICGTSDGHVYWSKDGKGIWNQFPGGLYEINSNAGEIDSTAGGYIAWYGGCYVDGYFYAIHYSGTVARSFDGEHWEKVTEFSASGYENITYFKNKFWAFRFDGTKYNVGLI